MKVHQTKQISLLVVAVLFLLGTATAEAQKVRVTGAVPSESEEGVINLDVEISGGGFDEESEVTFFVAGSITNKGRIKVNHTGLIDSKKVIANIDIPLGATLGDYDIEVSASRGRRGKGNTLFRVFQKGDAGAGNDCSFEFEATFNDSVVNGLVSDDLGSYVAFGGHGFRLDTNGGSQKLERKNDTRWVYIDFSVAGVCTGGNFAPAGFCEGPKGIDFRFEHWVGDPDMCPLQPGQSMPMNFVVSFESDPGNTLINEGQKGNGQNPLALSYGCTYFTLDPADQKFPGLLTRVDEYTWLIEGDKACLHTWQGNILVDPGGTVYLDMPFEITIVDVNAP